MKARANITIPEKTKLKAQKISEEIFGEINLSAYINTLINKDLKDRGIK